MLTAHSQPGMYVQTDVLAARPGKN